MLAPPDNGAGSNPDDDASATFPPADDNDDASTRSSDLEIHSSPQSTEVDVKKLETNAGDEPMSIAASFCSRRIAPN